MTIKSAVFIATSLDGFISRMDGALDWLDRANLSVPDGEDFGYKAFMDSVDALIIGRHTFEHVLSFDAWPYTNKRVVVLSHRNIPISRNIEKSVEISSEKPDFLLHRLETEGIRRVYVDGGRTIQSFLHAGLIDELTITCIPVLLGAGRPLFGPLPADVILHHVATVAHPCGFVQNKYLVESRSKAGDAFSEKQPENLPKWLQQEPGRIFINPKVGVAAIIEKEGKILLIKRKGDHGAGTWAVPGGHLEIGETPETCAIREVREEVGIDICDVQFIAITNDVFHRSGKHYITIWMRGILEKGDPFIAAEDEVAELGWFDWRTLPEPLFTPLENLINNKAYPSKGINKILRRKHGRENS